jgi:hypothetical protein
VVDVGRVRVGGQEHRGQGSDGFVEAILEGLAAAAPAEDFRRPSGAKQDGDADQHNREEDQEETH